MRAFADRFIAPPVSCVSLGYASCLHGVARIHLTTWSHLSILCLSCHWVVTSGSRLGFGHSICYLKFVLLLLEFGEYWRYQFLLKRPLKSSSGTCRRVVVTTKGRGITAAEIAGHAKNLSRYEGINSTETVGSGETHGAEDIISVSLHDGFCNIGFFRRRVENSWWRKILVHEHSICAVLLKVLHEHHGRLRCRRRNVEAQTGR